MSRTRVPTLVPHEPQAPFSQFQHRIDALFPPLRILPHHGSTLQTNLSSAGTRDLQLTYLAAGAHTVERRPTVGNTDEHEYYKISLQLTGTIHMTQGQRELDLSPGMITLYDTSRAYDLVAVDDFSFLVAMFPKRALSLPHGLASEFSAQSIPSDAGIGAVFATYLRSLGEQLPVFTSAVAPRLSRTFLDLLSSVLSEAAGQESFADYGQTASEHARLLHLVLEHIDRELADPQLTPATIAHAQHISVRQLYKIFAATGATVSQFIKQRRLEQIADQLRDPMHASESVGTIAARWGFSDASYFSRIFREHHGAAPSEWRSRTADRAHDSRTRASQSLPMREV